MNVARSTTASALSGAIAALIIGILKRVGVELTTDESSAILVLLMVCVQHFVSDAPPAPER
jgi:hypothetical protein